MTVSIFFYAHYVASKVGKTALGDVTVDVDSITRSSSARTALQTAAATTEGRDGWYFYKLTGANLALYDYVAVFKTADATVDQQHIPALRTVEAQLMNKDANSTYDESTDSLEALRDLLSASSITVTSAVNGGTLTIRTHNTLIASLTVGSLTGYKKIWFTVKTTQAQVDTLSIIQIAKYVGGGDGLLYLMGAPGAAGNGSIAIVTEATGAITVTLAAAAAASLVGGRDALYGEVKWMDATDQILTKTTYATYIEWGIGKVVA